MEGVINFKQSSMPKGQIYFTPERALNVRYISIFHATETETCLKVRVIAFWKRIGFIKMVLYGKTFHVKQKLEAQMVIESHGKSRKRKKKYSKPSRPNEIDSMEKLCNQWPLKIENTKFSSTFHRKGVQSNTP